VADVSTQTIPDTLTALLAAGGLALHLPGAIVPALLAGAVGGAFLGVQWLVSRGRWVGSGDVFLVGALGLFLGRWEYVLVALGAAYIVGAVYATGLLVAHGDKARGMHIPFAPFLIAGALLAYPGGAWVAGML
jgi:leader peptidase (prepilin peptidase) / N-methyltransferase